jgi:hypothetical protein
MTIRWVQYVSLISLVLLGGSCVEPSKWPFDNLPDGSVDPDRSGPRADGPAAGSGGAGGSDVGGLGGSGPVANTDGPEPGNQICGTTCESEKSDGCCPAGCNGASDMDCAAQCGNNVLEKGEQCDPPSSCPAACPNRGCTKFTLEGSAGMCTSSCVETGKETACQPDDGCCPTGCTGNDDNDCRVMCGNGAKEANETCDPLSTCPTTCPTIECQLRKMINPGTCTAECVNDRLQTACTPGDGCCPPGCHTGNDADCMVVCDNGIRESGESCEPLSSCPATCPAMECQLRKVLNPGTCKAQCMNDRLQTACMSGDDCCPPGCNTVNDRDCGIVCGDGIEDMGETCDPVSTCPATCPAMACQLRKVENAGTCKARCVNDRMQTTCMSGDDCCPPACNNNNDGECPARCGNGVVENEEKCEPVAECMRRQTACRSDRDTVRTGQGNPAQCTFECSETKRRCGDADGQCPSRCLDDPDCKKSNGSVCVTGNECVSGRCDGRCCASACPACQQCIGPGGACQLPSGVRVCGTTCKSMNDCCDTCGNECSPCNAAMNQCRPANGKPCNGGSGTCNNAEMCLPNCVAGSQACGDNNQCTTGRNLCPSGCQRTNAPDGTACSGQCNECRAGFCRTIAGKPCNGGSGTCNNGGTCIPNCSPDTQPCNTGNPCTTGLNLCPSGCRPTAVENGRACGGNGVCRNGQCQECTGNTDVRCDGVCSECCNNNSNQCSGGEVCMGNDCRPPQCGLADGLCPSGCTADPDCMRCGNGRREGNEVCDPCDTACPNNAENESMPSGSASQCNFRCNTQRRPCRNGDGFCPRNCTFRNDNNCCSPENTACASSGTQCCDGFECYNDGSGDRCLCGLVEGVCCKTGDACRDGSVCGTDFQGERRCFFTDRKASAGRPSD